ncbi:uncharacterized protein LOC143187239 [Calliopsis andreniformis]|uniref:uncharacterized protein LOC143187239 n=1 Tax=Calliopsis andreniformis TaxID=337506 RepID=UPI003FCD519F
MHWQFGGNLEPVQMICEVDWRECPKAIVNYVWSEIVTDVLDCLTNEGIVWRVLAAFFICTVLLRIICSKAKHLDDATAENEIFNKVGYKIEELELKVNILTYKMQYGSWPLPHQVHKSKFRKNLRNLRLTLSNPNERYDWIKQVLLRKDEPYAKHTHSSEQRLTELFDAKKNNLYPYLRRDNLSQQYSSRSSKSSSDKSIRLNSVVRKTIGQRQHKLSRNENLDLPNRNAISLPHFSRRKSSRFSKETRSFRDEKEARKKFLKTMADCKRYLKELHDSNKNLGLVCSSSQMSDGSSFQNAWSETQKDEQQEPQTNLSESSKENEPTEPTKEDNMDNEMNTKNTGSTQENKENCLEVSNAICPVLKVTDKHMLAPKMNITFCSDIFPRQSISNMLIPPSCEQTKFMQSSEEALYQVKKKLESLHNVLRTYEIRNSEAKVLDRQQDSNNKINSICQNVIDTLVSVTNDANCTEKRKSRVSFDTIIRTGSNEMQQTIYNSSEQYDTDDTGRSSEVSVQNYSSMFNRHYRNNLNEFQCVLPQKSENKIYSLNTRDSNVVNNEIMHSTTIMYNKIPERVYYTISSDLFENKDDNREGTNLYPDQQIVPIETDEDLVITSPASSRTEMSKDSESDDKSTALLLQEALQFRKALLTRIELEKVCNTDVQSENIHSTPIPDYGKYSYINNNLQSKLLDIISEEQSVSSSTEKTSRTYMYFNIKQDKQLARSPTFNNNTVNSIQQREINDQNIHKDYLESKDNLGSTSEYFSLSNIIQERSSGDSNQLLASKYKYLPENESMKMIPNNLQIKNVNHSMSNSDKKHLEMRFSNCLKNVDESVDQEEISFNYVKKKEHFNKRFLQMNNVNEVIDPNSESVELFSENLDETILDEEDQNANINNISNFLSCKSFKQCTNVYYSKDKRDSSVDATSNLLDEKYIEDSEILTSSPNLTLKRHPGTCSLIEQTPVTNTEQTEMCTLLEDVNTMYELSASESKENSIETNLIQDSFTSSANQSNDSNIPEPPSVTILTNKSADEEEIELNWLDIKNNISDDYINEKNTQTLSTDTIILQKYDSVEVENYCRQETCNENETLMREYETMNIHEENVKNEKIDSITKGSFTDLDNRESIINEAVHKSYSNLMSPHSSVYFTDEASSSAKLNNVQTKKSENYLQTNLYVEEGSDQLNYQAGNLKDTELPSISMSNETRIKQELLDSNKRINNNTTLPSRSYIENTYTVPFNEMKQVSKNEVETFNNKTSYINDNSYNLLPSQNVINNDQTRSNLQITRKELFNINQTISNISPHQVSPRNIKENTTRRMNTTLKSRSHENYTPKSEKLKKSNVFQNVKELKSDLFNTRRESSTISTHAKVRDLSAEPRRNTDHSIRLDKKRSRSQISFRRNEFSKHVTSQSFELPNSRNSEHSESILKSNSPVKHLLPTPKTSSKSCIPILKSRLEAARRSENEGRPKSPVRGPLTMTMCWRDNMSNKSPNVMEETIKVEGSSGNNDQHMEEINNYAKSDNNQDHADKQDLMKSSCIMQSLTKNTDNIAPQEPMVIYVNIFTKYDHNATKIVDPKKFLEYIKNRKLDVQKVIEENQSNLKEEASMISVEKEKGMMHKIVTIVSSITNSNELDATSVNLSVPKIKSESIVNTLSTDQLKHLCFLSVEQREIDVTAKPSVIDTSTSITDLNTPGTSKSILNKFQICGTPKELNSDEYIQLLEILHQESNFAHLRELQNVCKKLVSEHQKLK